MASDPRPPPPTRPPPPIPTNPDQESDKEQRNTASSTENPSNNPANLSMSPKQGQALPSPSTPKPGVNEEQALHATILHLEKQAKGEIVKDTKDLAKEVKRATRRNNKCKGKGCACPLCSNYTTPAAEAEASKQHPSDHMLDILMKKSAQMGYQVSAPYAKDFLEANSNKILFAMQAMKKDLNDRETALEATGRVSYNREKPVAEGSVYSNRDMLIRFMEDDDRELKEFREKGWSSTYGQAIINFNSPQKDKWYALYMQEAQYRSDRERYYKLRLKDIVDGKLVQEDLPVVMSNYDIENEVINQCPCQASPQDPHTCQRILTPGRQGRGEPSRSLMVEPAAEIHIETPPTVQIENAAKEGVDVNCEEFDAQALSVSAPGREWHEGEGEECDGDEEDKEYDGDGEEEYRDAPMSNGNQEQKVISSTNWRSRRSVTRPHQEDLAMRVSSFIPAENKEPEAGGNLAAASAEDAAELSEAEVEAESVEMIIKDIYSSAYANTVLKEGQKVNDTTKPSFMARASSVGSAVMRRIAKPKRISESLFKVMARAKVESRRKQVSEDQVSTLHGPEEQWCFQNAPGSPPAGTKQVMAAPEVADVDSADARPGIRVPATKVSDALAPFQHECPEVPEVSEVPEVTEVPEGVMVPTSVEDEVDREMKAYLDATLDEHTSKLHERLFQIQDSIVGSFVEDLSFDDESIHHVRGICEWVYNDSWAATYVGLGGGSAALAVAFCQASHAEISRYFEELGVGAGEATVQQYEKEAMRFAIAFYYGRYRRIARR